MKRIAPAVLAALLLVPQAYAGPWIKSLATAQKNAKASRQLIFVDLFADWCGWCHKMEQEVFPSEAFQKVTDDMVLLRLNTEDGGEGTRTAQQYNATSLPTFLVLTPDMMLAGVIRGYSPAPQFAQLVNEIEKNFAAFNKRVAQEASFRTDFQKRLDLAREFNQHMAYTQSEPRFRKLVEEKGVPVPIRDQAWFELAMSQAVQQHIDDALKTLGAFSKVQSKGDYFERSRMLLAQILYNRGDLQGAANELRAFRARFPSSSLMGNVNMMLPQIERRLAASR